MVDQYSDRNVRRWLHRAAKVRAYQYRLTHLARFRQQCVAWDATPHCTRARPRHPASSRGGCASCDSAARPCRFVAPGQLKRRGPLTAEERKTLEAAEALSTNDQEKQAVIFLRGAMFEREKNFDAAEAEFRRVLSAQPDNPGALNYLGYMFADRNVRLEEAQQMISKALDIDPGNGAYLDSLGWVHFRLNKLDQAAGELQEAIVKAGKDPTVHDHLGEVYFKQGKIKEAIQQWEASVAEMKAAAPSEQDPEELAKVTKKLEGAKVRVSEKK